MHKQGGLPIPGIAHIDQPYWFDEGGDLSLEEFGKQRAKQLEEKILEVGTDKVAAFIAEPIQGAGGVIIPPDSYWPEIQRICKKILEVNSTNGFFTNSTFATEKNTNVNFHDF